MPRRRTRKVDAGLSMLVIYFCLNVSRRRMISLRVHAFLHTPRKLNLSRTTRLASLQDDFRNSSLPKSFLDFLNQIRREEIASSSTESSAVFVRPKTTSFRKRPFRTENDNDAFFPFFPASPSTTRAGSMSMSQMVAMNAAGGVLTVAVIYALASSNLNGLLSGAATEDFEVVSFNIVDAALPTSATEVVTVTFSEAMAAVVAAIVSLSFSFLLRLSKRGEDRNRSTVEDIQKAVGNGDFLLAQATALPLLESLGVPPVLATTLCVIFAAVPAELVKVAGRQSRDRRSVEDKLFEMLLKEEQKRKRERSWFSTVAIRKPVLPPDATLEWQMSIDQTKRNQNESLLVEIVADLIKWLGFSVLCADLGGELTYNNLPLFPGLESAIFGITASLSAQVYADILYSYFGFGGPQKQNEVQARTLVSWATTYFYEAAYAGIFFGIYEFAQIPAKVAVTAFLSGGAEACYGSQDFDVCLRAFESQNPPGASPEAQLRSLITTLVSLWNRYTPDTALLGLVRV